MDRKMRKSREDERFFFFLFGAVESSLVGVEFTESSIRTYTYISILAYIVGVDVKGGPPPSRPVAGNVRSPFERISG